MSAACPAACTKVFTINVWCGATTPPLHPSFHRCCARRYSCEHGVTRAYHIIPNCEGRNTPFSFLLTRLPKPPKVVVFDFACQLMEYCLNREPEYFKHVLFLLDGFHKWNHKTCSTAFKMSWTYGDKTLTVSGEKSNFRHIQRHLNTQSAEQWNSMFQPRAMSIAQSNQGTAMREMRLVARHDTRAKNIANLAKTATIVEDQLLPASAGDQSGVAINVPDFGLIDERESMLLDIDPLDDGQTMTERWAALLAPHKPKRIDPTAAQMDVQGPQQSCPLTAASEASTASPSSRASAAPSQRREWTSVTSRRE